MAAPPLRSLCHPSVAAVRGEGCGPWRVGGERRREPVEMRVGPSRDESCALRSGRVVEGFPRCLAANIPKKYHAESGLVGVGPRVRPALCSLRGNSGSSYIATGDSYYYLTGTLPTTNFLSASGRLGRPGTCLISCPMSLDNLWVLWSCMHSRILQPYGEWIA